MEKDFKNNVKTLFSGSLIAQLINFLVLFLISKFYSTATIGDYFIFSALTQLMGPFTSLQSHMTIMLGNNTNERRCFLTRSILLSVGLNMLLLGMFWVVPVHRFIPQFPLGPEFLVYLPVSVFITNINGAFENFLTVNKQFAVIRNGRIIRASVLFVLQVGFGYLGGEILIYLIMGQLISLVVAGVYFGLFSGKFWSFGGVSLSDYSSRFKNLFIHNTSIAALSIGSSQVPYLVLKIFYSSEVVGFFGLAVKIVSIPFGLFGTNIGQVFFQRVSKLVSQQQPIMPLLKKTYSMLIRTGMIPFLLIFFGAPWGIDFFWGQQWSPTGPLIQITIFWLFLTYITTSIDTTYTVLNKQKYLTAYHLVLFVCRALGLLACGYAKVEFSATILVFTIISVIFNGFNHWLIFRYALRA